MIQIDIDKMSQEIRSLKWFLIHVGFNFLYDQTNIIEKLITKILFITE